MHCREVCMCVCVCGSSLHATVWILGCCTAHLPYPRSCLESSEAVVAAAGVIGMTGWLNICLHGSLLCPEPTNRNSRNHLLCPPPPPATYLTCFARLQRKPYIFQFSLIFTILFVLTFSSCLLFLLLSFLAAVKKASVLPNSRCLSESERKRQTIV